MSSEVKEDPESETKDEASDDISKKDGEKVGEVSFDNSGEDNKNKESESKPKDDAPKDKNKDFKEKKEFVNELKKKTKPMVESEDEESETEEKLGLLDRPVEVTGCRARKKVERLEIGFTPAKDKEKPEVPEGKGKKLGDCPRIEVQIQKTTNQELKPLHKILFNRIGGTNEIKKNIRKFSGFPFEKDSIEFNRKKASLDKLAMKVLKQACLLLDIERSGTKEEVVNRLLLFLLNPEDSGKKVSSKKNKSSKEKRKTSEKKSKTPKKSSTEKDESEEDNLNEDDGASGGDNSMGGSDEEVEASDEEMESSDKGEGFSDEKMKRKTKAVKAKPKVAKVKKDDEKVSKGQKRKHDELGEDTGNKLAKMPTDQEISKLVKNILEKADLQEITMKKVIKQVSDTYPDFDLSHKKAFIKSTIKSVIT